MFDMIDEQPARGMTPVLSELLCLSKCLCQAVSLLRFELKLMCLEQEKKSLVLEEQF